MVSFCSQGLLLEVDTLRLSHWRRYVWDLVAEIWKHLFHQMEPEYLPKHWSQVSLQSLGQNALISAASRVVMDTIKAHAHYESKLSEKVRLCLICVFVQFAFGMISHVYILQALFDLLVPLREGQRSVSQAQLNRLTVSHRKHSL